MKLEVKKLTKYYGKVCGIKDISFSIKSGEVFGFIGSNGAGKSTTIRSIMNLINKEGEVLIDGKVFLRDDLSLKRKIGYLPGEINLYDDLTVKEMLDYHESFYNDVHERRINLVNRFKLDETKKIEDLSLGNLKKLGIILTFMEDFDIYVLDEPTNGLDPIMQEEFYKLILEEKKKKKTILYSSHILSEVSRVCDRVGIIKNGEMVLIDELSSLIKNSFNIITLVSSNNKKIIELLKLKNYEEKGDMLIFKYQGLCDHLISSLSKVSIEKITINEASLEDIVMDYYK